MEKYTPWAITFGVGAVVMIAIRTALTLYGWKRGQAFLLNPAFSLLTPFVKLTWESKRFGDLLLLMHFLAMALVIGVAYLVLGQEHLIAFTSGVVLFFLFQHPGNIWVGVLDRYDIRPSTPARKPATPPPPKKTRTVPPAKPNRSSSGGRRKEDSWRSGRGGS